MTDVLTASPLKCLKRNWLTIKTLLQLCNRSFLSNGATETGECQSVSFLAPMSDGNHNAARTNLPPAALRANDRHQPAARWHSSGPGR
jgi:hypothetical protein